MKKGVIVFALVLLLTVAATAGYEIYMNTREYTIDDLTNPVVEVTGSRVIRDDSTGKVKTIEVDTRLADLADKNSGYDLRAIFYKQGEIIGVAMGYGDREDVDRPDVMTEVSDIGEYDNYEIFVVNNYQRPIFDR